MNNHYTKFEYIGMKTFGVTGYKTRHPKSVADGHTEGWTDGQSAPSTRPAFDKVKDDILMKLS